MASLTRSKRASSDAAVGTFVSTANVGAYLIAVKNADGNAQDLTTATAALEAIDIMMQNINAIGYTVANDATGTLSVLVDNSQHNAASLQVILRSLEADRDDSTVNVDFTGTTVTAATTITVA
jgi:hypothetical protein